MVYRAIGLMSGSSLDGLDIAFVSFEEIRSQWSFALKHQKCVSYSQQWKDRLKNAEYLPARDFVQLDHDFGAFMGQEVKTFITENQLEHQTQFIVSHGHTVFHEPSKGISTQIGAGAPIAAINSINVVNQLRALDVALGGQGAPIVPLGEQLLFRDYNCFLNLGGIANLSVHGPKDVKAFDICVANQALNHLARIDGLPFDQDGQIAAQGSVNTALLTQLNALPYFSATAPKSLSNQFFPDYIVPLLDNAQLAIQDLLRTVTEHIAMQITYSLASLTKRDPDQPTTLLVTGGGAHNAFLIQRLSALLQSYQVEVVLPEKPIIDYKEAIIMGLLGVLRWREENTVLGITGAFRPSIGGAVWMGQVY